MSHAAKYPCRQKHYHILDWYYFYNRDKLGVVFTSMDDAKKAMKYSRKSEFIYECKQDMVTNIRCRGDYTKVNHDFVAFK